MMNEPEFKRLAGWQALLLACAVVATVALALIAYAELRQADELRKANCTARAQVSAGRDGREASSTPEAEREFRRCLGVKP
jgi:hypothetical protein